MKRALSDQDLLDGLMSKISNLQIQGPQTLSNLHEIKLAIQQQQYISEAILELRKYLCTNDPRSIDEVLQLDIVGLLCQLQVTNVDLYEICWILTNLSAGNEAQTAELLKYNIIEWVIDQLNNSSSEEVKLQALWCVGNLAGDARDYRSQIVEQLGGSICNRMPVLIASESFLLKVLCWTLSNMCRLQPSHPCWSFIITDLEYCAQICHVFDTNDEQTIVDYCWALTRMLHACGQKLLRKRIVHPDMIAGLHKIVSRFRTTHVLIPAFRVLTNMAAGDDGDVNLLVEQGFITVSAETLTKKPYVTLAKECLMFLSNVAASQSHCDTLFDLGVIKYLVEEYLSKPTDTNIQNECLWIISNCISSAEDRIEYFIFI